MRDFMNVLAVPKINELRKISDSFDFKKGEIFRGRIIDISNDKSTITIKTVDGLEILANLEGDLEELLDELVKFEVIDFDNSKLNLKLIKSDGNFNKHLVQNPLDEILKKLFLSCDKKEILESMLKFNIPLTKEKVEEVNNLIEFRDKSIKSEKFIDNFIDRYLNSRDISNDNIKKEFTTLKLQNFFVKFKELSNDEILTFLENNIEFNENNIDSYNKLFKDDMKLFKSLLEIDKTLSKEVLVENKSTEKLNSETSFNNIKLNEDISKLINEIDIDELDVDIKNILDKLTVTSSKEEIEVLLNNIKDLFSAKTDLSNTDLKLYKFIEKLVGDLDTKENLNIKDYENINSKQSFDSEVLKSVKSEKVLNDEFVEIFRDFKEIKSSINNRQEQMKEIIRNLSEKLIGESKLADSIVSILKPHINDFKLFNDMGKEYYYLDIPVKLREDEYPCKLIIKDDRKQGRKIDSKNIKIVVNVKTINLGEIDALIRVSNKNLTVDFKVENKAIDVLKKNKKKLEIALEQLGYIAYIFVSEKIEEGDILTNYREFFNNENTLKLDRKV